SSTDDLDCGRRAHLPLIALKTALGRLNDVPTIALAVAAPQLRLLITDWHVAAPDRGRDQHAGELNGVGIG
ncbi:MAG TPA: hypothetical protein VHH52_10765, partial [Pseudonocardiaceae bacterium]|nr:hypothetical protein [Pseudonocardiaceae bacterium]